MYKNAKNLLPVNQMNPRGLSQLNNKHNLRSLSKLVWFHSPVGARDGYEVMATRLASLSAFNVLVIPHTKSPDPTSLLSVKKDITVSIMTFSGVSQDSMSKFPLQTGRVSCVQMLQVHTNKLTDYCMRVRIKH